MTCNINYLQAFASLSHKHWQVEAYNSHTQFLRVIPTRPGWSGHGEYWQISNDILFSRGDIYAADYHEEVPISTQCHFGIQFTLDAAYTIHTTAMHKHIDIRARQIWQRSGDLGEVATTWYGNQQNRLISLDFSPEITARWQEEGLLSTENIYGKAPLTSVAPIPTKRIFAHVARIIDQPVVTIHDRLLLESQILALCADHFAYTALPRKDKIDGAIDIIRSEYHLPLTITELAQRIGLNECYLKQQFKVRTGKTIANYIRDLRMNEAMRLLLDEHKTLQQTAWHVGYRNPDGFSRAFRKAYGISPATLVRNH
ncbi:AraC family transcriptional regulator [Cardiobacteriaceae bacterium TAE3-ERU3]|nr:AraC family transcriptional regulator [Cardiobacteriaceae bacterium TAE3-ERU3]